MRVISSHFICIEKSYIFGFGKTCFFIVLHFCIQLFFFQNVITFKFLNKFAKLNDKIYQSFMSVYSTNFSHDSRYHDENILAVYIIISLFITF